jgi:ribonuclease Y
MSPVYLLLGLIVGAIAGAFAGMSLQKKRQQETHSTLEAEARSRADKLLADAQSEAESVVRKAQLKAEERTLEAQRKAEQVALDAQRAAEQKGREQRAELSKLEERLAKRESALDNRSDSLDEKENDLRKREDAHAAKVKAIGERERALESGEETLQGKLEEIGRLSRDEARAEIIAAVTESAKLEAAKTVRQIEEEAVSDADRRAKKVLAVAIQRYAGEFVTERCVSVVNLPNDSMKGRIIGREGRNIRAIEAATGIDLIVDDTPEAVIISGFDPVRREVARLSLERLISDGRIHPSRIEEIVEKTKKEVDKIIKEAGDQAAFELGITDLHPEILKKLGRLKYRTSYGQNQWAHSIEVGFLCGLMAGELGLNVKLARRCGLLHDLGKSMDHDQEGSHAILGANWCKKHGEQAVVVNAIAAHHDEVKPTSVFAHLVMAGDALSGARPGARREILESYIKRLEDLERISKSFRGVQECFAIQAGREIRVMVENSKVSDDQALVLSKDIAKKIEEELVYPGQIKVTVIRETRAVEFAR